MRISDHGIAIDLPTGWEAEIVVRDDGAAARAGADEGPVDVEHAVAHVANFPLPTERGDFGSGAVEVMVSEDLLICLLEYDSESASTPLFAAEGIPTVTADDFSPDSMQRARKGQSGMQSFFHVGDRAFCLYVVVGSHLSRASRIDEINAILSTIAIDS